MFSCVGLYVVCSLFALFVPLCAMLCERVCVYGMVCMWRLLNDSIGLCCVCCYVIVSSFFLFLVCMVCLWYVVLLFVVSSVCRACMFRCCCFVFWFGFVCYGLNGFPVCDRMLYVPYLRCYFLFV